MKIENFEKYFYRQDLLWRQSFEFADHRERQR